MDPYGISVGTAWLASVGYTLQIYFDFSGYSDMAIGLGRLFGFRFPQNFDYPYTAIGATDFWRRWHITLSSWFREYLYIPLGGNRRGRARTYLNLFIVWTLTGLWHGAGVNFILWGVYWFLMILADKAFAGRLLERRLLAPSALSSRPDCLVQARRQTFPEALLGWVQRPGRSSLLLSLQAA